ncbi:YbhB/YbcL family Raf kinase inhibitor-like protein [Dickeya oryzae]|uniref:YbhB/YbcL family Raf kinase inhibitor-like protein n=1 Tax=Dickeya oryzae TaxID=1240404 RepID=A0AB39IGJ9_9GAMM|nr:YbhB/YbcL family Raf kinase inhibitor-like protein [Dickeya oryzae]MCA6994516.1 YbhB/YbcL family Raf kinase inhibitor-like protein [Dickeya oryzae]
MRTSLRMTRSCVSLFAGAIMTAAAAHADTLTLSSPAIVPNSTLPASFEFNGFGCSGQNQSPALNWHGAPAGTQSFAVTVYDPDAPTGSGWWHWMVINIPANVNSLATNAGEIGGKHLPTGARQVRIDYGVAAWGGVCPPAGDKPHRYIFTVYALKARTLDVPKDANPALGGFMINANTLAKASFTAYYGRPAQ